MEILLIRRYQANTETLLEKLGDADTVIGLLSIVLGAGRGTDIKLVSYLDRSIVVVLAVQLYRNWNRLSIGV